MEAVRNSWTDDRLDHLSLRVDEGFDRMTDEFARVDKRFDEGFERMDREFARVDKRMATEFTRVDSRMADEFARVDNRIADEFTRVDKRLDKVEEAIVRLSVSVESLRNVLQIGTLGLLGTVIAAAVAIVAAQ